MKRHSIPALTGLLLAAALLAAPSAQASPTLDLEIVRTPTTINRGDEFASYEIKVENTSASDPTSGPLSVAISLPEGLTLGRTNAGTGGWSCDLANMVCANSTAVPPGGSYPPLVLTQVWISDGAPDTVVAAVAASGAGAGTDAIAEDSFTFGPRVPFGLDVPLAGAFDEAGNDFAQAGGHPFAATAIFRPRLRTSADGFPTPVEDLRTGISELPAGFVGAPSAVEATCTKDQLDADSCPPASAIGGAIIDLSPGRNSGAEGILDQRAPVYRMVHERGYPAIFGFKTVATAYLLRTVLRSDGDYGISVILPSVASEPELFESEFTFCEYGAKVSSGKPLIFLGCRKPTDPDRNRKAFISLSTDCSIGKPLTRFAVDSWLHRGRLAANGLPDLSDPNWVITDVHSSELTGCGTLTEEWTGDHEPSFDFTPDSHAADSPAGYTASVHVPQGGLEDHQGLSTSHLKDVKVTLPGGIGFNPGIGDGLAACSEQQIGLLGTDFPRPSRIRFDNLMPNCPPNSKVGLGTVKTPVLDETLHGSVYLARQKENPFGSDYAIYLAIEEPDTGIISKLAGKVVPDPRTGQVTTTFAEAPQVPFSDLTLQFFGGPRSALANPPTCGSFTAHTEMSPWSAEVPYNPRPDEIARPGSVVQVDSGPGGSRCAFKPSERPFDIGFSAGSRDPIAGAKSPFSMRITRPDGSQEIIRLEISPPPGFVGSLKGIPYCSEAQIQAASSNSGKAEQKSPSCPAASQLGTTNSGAGAGPAPYYAPGKIYLAGPYKGQTLSAVAITPAVAGPFDLGNVVIRSALKLDPVTARITAITDPLPQIVKGIPLRIRDVRIDLDRPGWAQSPTNCESMSADLTAYGASGAVTRPSSRYQLGGCENLGFKPKLEIHLKGGTKRGDHPALLATLSTSPGDANIARAAVTLPPSAFLDQSHIRTICTRVQFAANACPAGAIYGSGKAVTQLLDDPIEGNVYLRSSDNKLPDLVAALKGVANIEAVGRIDSVHGGIRNTFDIIPDAPFETFTLKMQGGKKGLVVNSQNLCAKDHRATVKLTAQNGRHYDYRPKVIADNCAKAKKVKRGHRRHKG